ncbi:hypothetical protein SCHPADRAFT_74677 [Schizopora paradoxa]|uniref:Uncharacterized protein n=1 Tax=Schizopora paradoxa TaxID=27342 RepID=A0A0H2SQL3_9AGAM|nr:hypothetical protein SCHPADRAFT_74677 [Schizopora paradoxa]
MDWNDALKITGQFEDVSSATGWERDSMERFGVGADEVKLGRKKGRQVQRASSSPHVGSRKKLSVGVGSTLASCSFLPVLAAFVVVLM